MAAPIPAIRGVRRWILAGGGLALVSVACQEMLPTAPDELDRGIVVYEHADYLGESAHITSNVEDLKDFEGPCIEVDDGSTLHSWNDCISSIRVAPGWRVTVYEDDDFDGDNLDLTSESSNLTFERNGCKTGFNDCITSIRVFAP